MEFKPKELTVRRIGNDVLLRKMWKRQSHARRDRSVASAAVNISAQTEEKNIRTCLEL